MFRTLPANRSKGSAKTTPQPLRFIGANAHTRSIGVFAVLWLAGITLLFVALMTAFPAHAQTETETTISTDGIIESTVGGFKFPDGSVQDKKDSGDTLFELDCLDGEVAVWDNTPGELKWVCGTAPEGPKGDKGDTGDTGDTGARGLPGDQGAQGTDGANCWEAVGGSTVDDCIGTPGANGQDGVDGASCSVTECSVSGEATLSCPVGPQLLIPCVFICETTLAVTQVGADIDGETNGDLFGVSVAMSDDAQTVVIGANWNDGSFNNAGHARVYRYIAGSWTQLGLDIDGEAAGDESGWSVAMSSDGNTVVVGAPYNDGSFNNAGHARVYRYIDGSWAKLGDDIDGEAAEDKSGWAVAMSSDGNTVIIGARQAGGFNVGHARVYHFNEGVWTQLGGDIDGEAHNDESGYSVAMSSDGETVVIGAIFNGGTPGSGHVRVYHLNENVWEKVGQDIDGEAAGDQFGQSVAMSSDGNTIIVGGVGNDAGGNVAGHVRMYRYSEGSWVQLGVDLDGEAANDEFGSSVAMSSDGNTVASVSKSNTGGGSMAGHARVFRYADGSWGQLGPDIDGEPGEQTGIGVAMSRDGNTVAVGASDLGIDAGHVRVHKLGCAAP